MPFHQPGGGRGTCWVYPIPESNGLNGNGSGHEDGAKAEPNVILYDGDGKPAIVEQPPKVGFRNRS